MIEHLATVRDRAITWDKREVVQHGLNSDTIRIDADGEFASCDTLALILFNASNPRPMRYMVDETLTIRIPSALMEQTGALSVCLIGYVGGAVRIVTKQERMPLVVVKSGEIGGIDPDDGNPDLWGQLLAAEAARVEAENGREAAEALRVAAETARAAAETEREKDSAAAVKAANDAAATASKAAEKAKADTDAAIAKADAAEQARASAETLRVEAENGRVTAENLRIEAENLRVSRENERQNAETARSRAEAARVEAERGREAAEALRVAAEAERADAEAARAEAELARRTAETRRVEAETTRAAHESKRIESFNINLVSWNGKVDAACKKATDTASKAAQDAKTATDAAIAKTEEATQAAVAKAQTATDNATTAANKAEAAVSKLPLPLGNTLKGKVEATLVNVDDAYPAPLVTTKVLGQSNQVTTTGKNLLGGERYVSGYDIRGFKNILKPNTQYTYSNSGITDGTAAFKLLAFNAQQSKVIGLTVGYITNASETFTTPENIGEFEELYLGGNYNEAGKNCINSHFQVEEGAKATAYEPYTGGKPSPSPDYPQEITNLNKAELVITGRNICPDAELLGYVTYNNGIPVNNSRTQAEFPYVQSRETYGIGAVLNTIKGVTYSIAYLGKANTAAVGIAEYKSVDDVGDIGKVVSYARVGSSKKISLTASIDGVMVFILASQWSNGTTNLNTFAKEDMIISVGEPCGTYTPHQSKSTPIDLKGNELLSIPNGVRDEVVIDAEGNVSLIKRVVSVTVDGANLAIKTVSQTSGGNPRCSTSIANTAIISNGEAMCDRFTQSTIHNGAARTFYIGNNNTLHFIGDESSPTTVDGWNEWFVAKPTTVFYKLTTPQTIPLGKVELPALPEATSNIWNDGNIQTDVGITYVRDANIVIGRLEDKLARVAYGNL